MGHIFSFAGSSASHIGDGAQEVSAVYAISCSVESSYITNVAYLDDLNVSCLPFYYRCSSGSSLEASLLAHSKQSMMIYTEYMAGIG